MIVIIPADARFFPGVLLMTPGAVDAFERTGDAIYPFLHRHLRGDWGDLDSHDRKENEYSLRRGAGRSGHSWHSGIRSW